MNIRNIQNIKWFMLLAFVVGTMNLFAQTTDTDGDGVTNDKDLCPNTPIGTIVNTYGCPTNLATCDYSTNSFSATIIGSAPTETRYLLVNSATGIIEQINTTATFTGLTGTKTYMVLAYSYTNAPAGLSVGNQLSAVSATCQDFSNALVVKVCVPVAVIPTLSINDVTVNENAGTVTLTITASGTSTNPMTVNYATADGTALAGTDYTTTTGTATIPAGSTSTTITIPIVDNTTNELTETFNVNLSSPIGATIADNQGVATIIDNDPVDNDTDKDGVTNDKDLCPNTPIGTTVNTYGCPTNLATCDYSTSSFSANIIGAAPTETRYLLVNSATGIIEQINTTATFSGLTGTKTYMVLAYSYTNAPAGLTVGNQLSAVTANCQDFSNALVVKVCVPVAILPSLSINDVIVNENVGTVTLTITASGTSTSPISVNYATANGAALVGTDYISTTGTATIPAGSTSITITIPIVDDAINELTETFNVNLSNPIGATIADSQGAVTILDNDPVDNDVDKDGVTNDKDLCPNTPIGTIVNIYGCPVSLVNCDYTTPSVTFNSGIPPTGKVTKYVLADAVDGKIVQVSNTPTFSALTGTKTYMVLAYSYEDDASIVNLAPNNFLNQVTATCADWSNALVVKICVPVINDNCDYTTSNITLNLATPAPSNATTKYVLVSQAGTIIQVSNTPAFTGLSGTNVYNVYAISYTGTINNLSAGNSFASVGGTCFDWSNPISIKVCVCKPNICIPIVITKIKN